MSYSLDQFCNDCHDFLSNGATDESREQIRAKLEQLLVNQDFIKATFSEDMAPGKRVLYHDTDSDAYVLAHIQNVGKGGKPHSHGSSWAIYGNITGFTDMTEWRRVNGEDEDHAELEVDSAYRINPGEAKAYGPGLIHSTAHPEGAWVIRITGCDLDHEPRFRFNPERDKILAEA